MRIVALIALLLPTLAHATEPTGPIDGIEIQAKLQSWLDGINAGPLTSSKGLKKHSVPTYLVGLPADMQITASVNHSKPADAFEQTMIWIKEPNGWEHTIKTARDGGKLFFAESSVVAGNKERRHETILDHARNIQAWDGPATEKRSSSGERLSLQLWSGQLVIQGRDVPLTHVDRAPKDLLAKAFRAAQGAFVPIPRIVMRRSRP